MPESRFGGGKEEEEGPSTLTCDDDKYDSPLPSSNLTHKTRRPNDKKPCNAAAADTNTNSRRAEDSRVKAMMMMPRQRLDFNCHHCKVARVKCERMLPCARCIRLNRECYPQERGVRGRPLKLHKTRSQLAEEQGPSPPLLTTSTSLNSTDLTNSEPSTSEESTITCSTSTTGGYKRTREEMTGSTTASMSGLAQVDSGARGDYDDLLSSIAVPPLLAIRRAVRTMAEAFSRLKAQGRVDERYTTAIIKRWSSYNDHFGVDVSMGLLSTIKDVLGQASIDHFYSRPMDPNVSTDFRLKVDRGEVPFEPSTLPPFLQQLNDSHTAVTAAVFGHGFHVYCNDRFGEGFFTCEEMVHQLHHLQALPILLWSMILHPDEIVNFYTEAADHIFSGPQPLKELSTICKCIEKNGKLVSGLVRVRTAMTVAGDFCMVLSIVPMPSSRYIFANPVSPSPLPVKTATPQVDWGADQSGYPIDPSASGGTSKASPFPDERWYEGARDLLSMAAGCSKPQAPPTSHRPYPPPPQDNATPQKEWQRLPLPDLPPTGPSNVLQDPPPWQQSSQHLSLPPRTMVNAPSHTHVIPSPSVYPYPALDEAWRSGNADGGYDCYPTRWHWWSNNSNTPTKDSSSSRSSFPASPPPLPLPDLPLESYPLPPSCYARPPAGASPSRPFMRATNDYDGLSLPSLLPDTAAFGGLLPSLAPLSPSDLPIISHSEADSGEQDFHCERPLDQGWELTSLGGRESGPSLQKGRGRETLWGLV